MKKERGIVDRLVEAKEDNEPKFALNDPTVLIPKRPTPQTPTSCHQSEFLAVH